jgi:mRNA interferase MazF
LGNGGAYVPERGDLIWITFQPQAGHEQSGRRPALVLSPAAYNGRAGLAILCSVTQRSKGYTFEVRLPEEGVGRGVILSDQLKSLDHPCAYPAMIGVLDTVIGGGSVSI